MKILSDYEVEQVGGGMTLPPYDETQICVTSSSGYGPQMPREPLRSDYPAGSGGDAVFRYEYAKYRHVMVNEFNATVGCFD